jgi:hypothetical protein
MNFLYPKIPSALLPAMFGYALAGAVLAGLYGIAHDQLTYSISPEYFTKLKFAQFHYADFGLPTRVFVGEIGLLATWWVGLVAGWFIARAAVPACSRPQAFRCCARGFLIVMVSGCGAGIFGYVLGLLHGSDYSSWEPTASELGILDVPGFVRVAYIHNAGYFGGLFGLIFALIYLRNHVRQRPYPNDR